MDLVQFPGPEEYLELLSPLSERAEASRVGFLVQFQLSQFGT
jgi:hypothetical protein